jgi:uncharacterized protein
VKLREPGRGDWPQMLELNRASVQELSPLDEQRLAWILALAHWSRVVESNGELVAFAIAIAPGTSYDSENYRWFEHRYERFLYLDRIVVAANHRRRGLAGRLYDELERAVGELERVACEVNLQPPNPASLAFHSTRGYVELGRLGLASEKLVALLGKECRPSSDA